MKPEYFDKDYYDGGKGYCTYNDDPRFQAYADYIVERFAPSSVLDFGCAKGFLVKALRDRGVTAYGYDISDWAINNGHESVKPFLSDKIILPTDLVVSYDTWEHIPEDQIQNFKVKLKDKAEKFYFVVGTLDTPDWQHDASHINMHKLDWWKEWWPEAEWVESR